jgi:hypothetical protein
MPTTCVVGEIEIIRLAAAGEQELWRCRALTAQDGVVAAGIMEREYGLDQKP